MRDPTPHVPIDEQHQEHEQIAGQTNPPDTNWTAHTLNILRGNLDRQENSNDPRTHVGWSEDPTGRVIGPWMSTTEQQPLMWGENSEKDDEA